MARVHFLTVGAGDCTIIQHNSGRVTVIDVCGGNRTIEKAEASLIEAATKPRGNFAMCNKPTNPIEYLKRLGTERIFRFILSHPDMDHLDGFDNLASSFKITNFWDSGARKEKPEFSGGPYKEEDWDRYVSFRDGGEAGVTVVTPLAGERFQYANRAPEDGKRGDGLHIASPNQGLVDAANDSEDHNDCSYVISYRSTGGLVVFPGDAHDESWSYAIGEHADDLTNVAFLLAPHHGRKSDRDYTYLDTLKPQCSLLGCAPSEYLAYDAWRNRGLDYFTQNQAGNVVLEIEEGYMDIYIENGTYAKASGGDVSSTNQEGYYFLRRILK